MYVGLTQAGPEKPGQPCTHTALLHKIEGKEQKKKKVAFFKELTASFFLRPKKTKEKVFIAKSFPPLSYMYQSITSYTVKTHIKNLCFEGSG